MSDNSNPNNSKVLVIPDAEQIQRDAELFGTTRQYLEWAGAVATGQQEGTSDDVVNALTVVHTNIAALEERHLIASAAVAGLREMAEKLTEQRDQVIQEKAQLESNMDDALAEARDEGFNDGLEYAANADYYYDEPEYDLDEAWGLIKDEMETYAEQLSMKLDLLGEKAAGKELHTKVQAAIRAYDEADSAIIQYQKYCNEHADELNAKRHELQQRQAERFAAEHPLVEDTDADSEEDAED